MKTIYIIGIFLILILAGCAEVRDAAIEQYNQGMDQNQNYVPEPKGPTINEYFGKEIINYYRMIEESSIDCINGTCPESIGLSNFLKVSPCFFCNASSEVKDGKVYAYISSPNYMDAIGNCVEKDSFGFPGELTIINETDQLIIAVGNGSGWHSQDGLGCSKTYKYSYKTQEKWIFSKTPLGNATNVTVTSDPVDLVIHAPGWRNPTSNPIYSKDSITVECISHDGFSVSPYVAVININGHEASGHLQLSNEKIDDNTMKVKFASFYDAHYTVVGACKVFGGNPDTFYDSKEYKIIVTGSPQGDLPESYYK